MEYFKTFIADMAFQMNWRYFYTYSYYVTINH